MVQSLIQRIRENKLDALYLFINESLRDRNEFDVFFQNLMVVLPNNWSINRVEIGHEFLSRTVVTDQQQGGQVQGNNNDSNESKQDELFRWVCSLESLRSLIISDGYIPRKDHGFVDTKALLRNLPRANNLQYLDIQRLKLRITADSIEDNDAELLAESLDSVRDSLEDLRLTAISMCDTRTTFQDTTNAAEEQQLSGCIPTQYTPEQQLRRYPLDATIRVCGEMANLQLLAISCANSCECNSDNGEDQQQQQQQLDGADNRDDIIRDAESETDSNSSQSSNNKSLASFSAATSCLISREVLLLLCRSSSTLQELALRSMRIDDDTCKTIARAFDPPGNSKSARTYLLSSTSTLSLPCSENEQDNDGGFESDDASMNDSTIHHSPSFWTSLDLRQNPSIGTVGYEAILSSLERNYDLWCSLMVDNDSFQSRFNALIELNQANRGALVRSPTPEKLAVFMDRLRDDPTALWYFLTIHRDSILHPLIRYLKWKNAIEQKNRMNAETTIVGNRGHLTEQQQQQVLQGHEQKEEIGQKRTASAATVSLSAVSQPTSLNGATTAIPDGGGINPKDANQNRNGETGGQLQQSHSKRPRQSMEEVDLSRQK